MCHCRHPTHNKIRLPRVNRHVRQTFVCPCDTFSGVEHLLPSGRGVGGIGDEAIELRMACFMSLVSLFASRPEVLYVSPKKEKHLLNAAARAIVQTATVTDTPLTDAGLDGTGEVIQVRWRRNSFEYRGASIGTRRTLVSGGIVRLKPSFGASASGTRKEQLAGKRSSAMGPRAEKYHQRRRKKWA